MSENIQTMQELTVSPKKTRARKGQFRVIIHNKENIKQTYRLKANDSAEICNYLFNNDTITVESGVTVTVALTVSFKKSTYVGTPKVCNFTVSALKDTQEVITAEGQLEFSPRLPMWVLGAGGLALVAIIAVIVVFTNKGGNPVETAITTSTTISSSTVPSSTTSTQKSTTTSPVTTSTTATSAITTTTTTMTETPPDLNGSWNFTITVTTANGVCAGEEGTRTETIQITQNGMNVTFSGFQGNPANKLIGELTFESGTWVIKVTGSYPEDGGTTTSTYNLAVENVTRMSGEESWEWTGGGGTCPDSKASVTATRISPFQGTITGTWTTQTDETPPSVFSGTYTVTIDADGNITGTFNGSYSGFVTGKVDLYGNMDATGTASGGTTSGVTTWKGKLSIAGNTLSADGDLSGEYVTGTFTGSGTTSN